MQEEHPFYIIGKGYVDAGDLKAGEQVGVDKVAHALENFKNSGENIDSSIEILEGEFKHGGVRIIKYYYDKNGNLTVKSQASETRTFELDKEGNEVWGEIKK